MSKKLTPEQELIVQRLFKTFSLDTAPSAILALDNHYTILYMNDAAEELYGWSKKEAIGNRDSNLLKTRLLGSTNEEYRRALRARGAWSGESVQCHKNGSRVFVLSNVQVIKNERGSAIGMYVVNRNITEHKQIEYNLKFLSSSAKALSSSLNYQTTLSKVAQLAVPRIADWCSIEILNKEGKLNQVALAHRDPAKIKWAIKLRKTSPPDLTQDSGIGKVFKTGKPEFYPYIPDEVLFRAADNPKTLALLKKIGMSSVIIVPMINDDAVIGAITLVSAESRRHFTQNDLETAEKLASRATLAIQNATLFENAEREIAERKQTQERLRAREHQLDIILGNIADGITMQNVEGTIVYSNDIAAKASGFTSAHEMMYATPEEFAKRLQRFDICDEHGNAFLFSDLPGRKALKGEEAPDMIVQFRNRLTGETKWSRIKARAVKNDKGNVDYTVNIISDITEQRELENRKDNFISMASHELKTPITTLKIYTDLLSRQLTGAGLVQFSKTLWMMDGQINKLSTLIADLLNLSKIQAGKLEFRMQKFNLDDLIKNIVEQLRPSIRHTITISGKTDEHVRGDPERIGQVIINLLTNAAKYSPDSDKITITLKKDTHAAQVSVRDYGIGIEKQYKNKIFERFYQVSDREKTFPGLGMGLYISQEIIKRHNGVLSVSSTKDKGSTFSFSLPLPTRKKSVNKKR